MTSMLDSRVMLLGEMRCLIRDRTESFWVGGGGGEAIFGSVIFVKLFFV